MAIRALSLLPLLALAACDPPEEHPPVLAPGDTLFIQPSSDVDLPVVAGGVPPELAVNLVVSTARIEVDGVPVLQLRSDGELLAVPPDHLRGFLIAPLYDRLLERAEVAKHLEERVPEASFDGRVLLQLDRQLPISLVRQVLYTAGQAQFARLQFVVLDPVSGQLAMVESALPAIGRCSSLRTMATGPRHGDVADIFAGGDGLAAELDAALALVSEAPVAEAALEPDPSVPRTQRLIQATLAAGTRESEPCPEPPPLMLSVMVTREGFQVTGAEDALGCFPDPAPCTLPCRLEGCASQEDFDIPALQAMLSRVKKAFPEQEAVVIVHDSSLSYGLQIAVVAAVTRDASGEPLFSQPIIAGGAS